MIALNTPLLKCPWWRPHRMTPTSDEWGWDGILYPRRKRVIVRCCLLCGLTVAKVKLY